MLFLIALLSSLLREGKSDDTSTETWPDLPIQQWRYTQVISLVAVAILFPLVVGILVVTCSYAATKLLTKLRVNAPVFTENTLENVETVIDVLKKLYRKAGQQTLYTTCDCVITRVQEEERKSTSDEILQKQFFENNERVLIIGEEGFGKTYLLQYVLQQWAKGIILNDVILIYIKLHGLSRNSCILEEVVKATNGEIQSVEAMSSALQQRNTLVLLDGLSHLKLKTDSATKTSRNNSLTVENLLNNELNSFPRLKVWATVRLNKSRKLLFPTKETSVNLNGFTDCQRKTYWKNTITDIDPTRVQNLDGNEITTESMEANWKNIFTIDSNVKKSPLLTHIFFLLSQGSFTKEYCYQKLRLNFSLTDNVYVFWKLWKYWDIDNWCRKFEKKDIVFDREAPGYSEDLVKDVCNSCKRSGVKLGKLTFRGDFPPATYEVLPDIKTDLIIESVKLPKGDYNKSFRPFEGKSFKIIIHY
ncbi:uncharacterized protein [Apostichopus japonicus]|uniref:uncharacterized protein isoform X2 n=1 Tax=Stichopus japonicus TaxID=307972 RepID=UPI003AB495CE